MSVATRPMSAPSALRYTDEIRDRFLNRVTDDLSSLRPVVARSWRRSRAAGVDGQTDRGYIEEGRVDERTTSVAAPHLRKLDEMASDIGGYVSLTSPNGALVKAPFLRDDSDFPPGYSLLEASCGSNGEGVALEEGRAVWLSPEEHFRDDMRGNWCFASLIRDPFHNRVRGVIGLTLPAARVGQLEPSATLLMLENVTSRIEHEIETLMSARERTLMREYLTTSRRRGAAAVIATDGKHSIMNANASASLEGADLSVIAGYTKGVMSTGHGLSAQVVLSGSGPATIDVAPVDLSASSYGAVAVIRLGTSVGAGQRACPAEPPAHEASLRERLHGQSMSFQRLIALTNTAIEQRRSVLILGEPGSGKSHLAEVIARARGGELHLDARHGDVCRRFEAARAAHREASGVLMLTHADELSTTRACDIAAQLRSGGDWTIVMTAGSPSDATRVLSDVTGPLEIPIAPLRRRREDIPLLANAIADEVGDRRLSRKVLSTLTDSDWPRNVTQLRQVVVDAAAHCRGIEITETDLPEGFHRVLTGGRLSRLEDAELVEIRSALREAGGNRRLAAEILEIGRSTLYRRMDYFRSRGFDI
ncbi:helix-turn-helix domain-containing protein [Kineococcus aurantiacus]|uniref:helix-turn-helix domain-containing protein n=1 Tax=Kineococcus aurantiacus TaxID=37633 RepID=UPI001C54935E